MPLVSSSYRVCLHLESHRDAIWPESERQEARDYADAHPRSTVQLNVGSKELIQIEGLRNLKSAEFIFPVV